MNNNLIEFKHKMAQILTRMGAGPDLVGLVNSWGGTSPTEEEILETLDEILKTVPRAWRRGNFVVEHGVPVWQDDPNGVFTVSVFD